MDAKKIVQIAEEYNRKGVLWHHHFLAMKCIFNTSDNFQIIIENEEVSK